MTSMTATGARRSFGQMLKLAEKEPVFIQKNGGDVAVVVSAEPYASLQAQLPRSVNPLVIERFKKSLAERGEVYKALARYEAEHPETPPVPK